MPTVLDPDLWSSYNGEPTEETIRFLDGLEAFLGGTGNPRFGRFRNGIEDSVPLLLVELASFTRSEACRVASALSVFTGLPVLFCRGFQDHETRPGEFAFVLPFDYLPPEERDPAQGALAYALEFGEPIAWPDGRTDPGAIDMSARRLP